MFRDNRNNKFDVRIGGSMRSQDEKMRNGRKNIFLISNGFLIDCTKKQDYLGKK